MRKLFKRLDLTKYRDHLLLKKFQGNVATRWMISTFGKFVARQSVGLTKAGVISAIVRRRTRKPRCVV